MAIILTIALCYIAAGIYSLMVFDHADAKRGRLLPNFTAQVRVVLTWPGFLYFVAHEHEYEVVIGDDE